LGNNNWLSNSLFKKIFVKTWVFSHLFIEELVVLYVMKMKPVNWNTR